MFAWALKLIGIGKSAASSYGWVLLVVGLLPSIPLAWTAYSKTAALSECQEARAIESEQALVNALAEMNRLNAAAEQAGRTIQTIRESGDAFREEMAGVDLACDLGPVRDGLQQHLETIRAARAASVAP